MAKPPIYILPGWGFDAALFQHSFLNEWAYKGLDYIDKADGSLESIANSLAEKIPNNSLIVGWSFGGLIAIKIAYLFPAKVKRIILLNTTPRFLEDSDWMGVTKTIADNFIYEAMSDFPQLQNKFIELVNYPNHRRQYKQYLSHYFIDKKIENLISLLKMLMNVDVRAEYASLVTNILHIIADKDAIIKMDQDQLKQLNAELTFMQLENKGHAGFFVVGPYQQAIVREFINHA